MPRHACNIAWQAKPDREPPAGCTIESSSNRTKIDLIFPAQFIAHRQRINA